MYGITNIVFADVENFNLEKYLFADGTPMTLIDEEMPSSKPFDTIHCKRR